MKQIERFLNHLYFAVYLMTAWFSHVSTRKLEEYESSLELTCIYGGLNNIYAFLFFIATITVLEYFCGISLLGIIFSNMIVFIFIALIIMGINDLCLRYFVYRDKKYVNYCREFEKESRLTKMMWCLLVIALFVLAVIIFILLLRFRQLYIPKPMGNWGRF